MQFRDLKTQYEKLKPEIEGAIFTTLEEGCYISGKQVKELETLLAEYVGVKHCITCANGTDALEIALMAMGVKGGDRVIVPDFTFFASAEAPAHLGAEIVFVDIDADTYNISASSLENTIEEMLKKGEQLPKVVITVDLFGLTADYNEIRKIADKYGIKILEDGAQSFGAEYHNKKACSLGDVSTTSFFPAKPLGCYGDGGAIFTDNDEYAELIRSLCVHGKGADKYDNVRIGKNSRLDTIQAAVLIEKFKAFKDYELEDVNSVAKIYSQRLKSVCSIPIIPNGYGSSWAQYTIKIKDKDERVKLQEYLKGYGIPTNIYYSKPLHKQKVFEGMCYTFDVGVVEDVCNRVLSLPMGPYITEAEVEFVCEKIEDFYA